MWRCTRCAYKFLFYFIYLLCLWIHRTTTWGEEGLPFLTVIISVLTRQGGVDPSWRVVILVSTQWGGGGSTPPHILCRRTRCAILTRREGLIPSCCFFFTQAPMTRYEQPHQPHSSPSTRKTRSAASPTPLFPLTQKTRSTTSPTLLFPLTCRTCTDRRVLCVRRLPHPAFPLKHLEHAQTGVFYVFATSLTLPFLSNTKNMPIWACFLCFVLLHVVSSLSPIYPWVWSVPWPLPTETRTCRLQVQVLRVRASGTGRAGDTWGLPVPFTSWARSTFQNWSVEWPYLVFKGPVQFGFLIPNGATATGTGCNWYPILPNCNWTDANLFFSVQLQLLTSCNWVFLGDRHIFLCSREGQGRGPKGQCVF